MSTYIVNQTGQYEIFDPKSLGKDFTDIFGEIAAETGRDNISTFEWQSDPNGKIYRYSGSCFIHELEYRRIVDLLKDLGLGQFSELIFPTIAFTYIRRRNFKYRKQDFEGLLKLHELLKIPGLTISGVRLKMEAGNEGMGYTITDDALIFSIRQVINEYLKSSYQGIVQSARKQKEKTKRFFMETRRESFLIDTFDSIQNRDLSDYKKYVILGKILVATGHLDGEEKYKHLIDQGKGTGTYSGYHKYLHDHVRKLIERGRKRLGTKTTK